MSDPHIPFGLDNQEEYVHIHDAEKRSHYYRCPECREFLKVRQGDIYIWHYAHLSSCESSPNPDCSLRTHYGVQEWVDKNKEIFEEVVNKSPVQKEEEKHVLPLVIMTTPYTNNLELYGILIPPMLDDIDDSNELQKAIETIKVEGGCIAKKINTNRFHPSEVEVLIPLKPDSSEFQINFTSNPTIERLEGVWKRGPIKTYDIFLGNEYRAHKISKNAKIKMGSTIYIILNEKIDILPSLSNYYKLDDYWVISFEVNQSTISAINDLLPTRTIDNNTFQVDVILPPQVNPNPLEPILGSGESEALLGIIPPKHLDPEFEVVSVPLYKESFPSIPPQGYGVPRFLKAGIPIHGMRRISIHWGSRHHLVQLHSAESDSISSFSQIKEIEHKIGILLDDGDFITPWVNNDIKMKLREEIKPNHIGFKIIGPKYLKIDLEGYFPSEGGRTAREYDVDYDKIEEYIGPWLFDNCTRIKLNFATLGTVTINFATKTETILSEIEEARNKVKKVKEKLIKIEDGEIKNQLLALPKLPKKVTWRVVREVLEIDKSIKHNRIYGGIKKRIRKILHDIKRDRK